MIRSVKRITRAFKNFSSELGGPVLPTERILQARDSLNGSHHSFDALQCTTLRPAPKSSTDDSGPPLRTETLGMREGNSLDG